MKIVFYQVTDMITRMYVGDENRPLFKMSFLNDSYNKAARNLSDQVSYPKVSLLTTKDLSVKLKRNIVVSFFDEADWLFNRDS